MKNTLALAAAALVGLGTLESPAQGLLNRNSLLSRTDGRTPSPAAAPSAPQKTSDPGAANVEVGGRSIEFNGAALDIVLMVYGNLVGKTVLKDPSTPAASITLQPKQGQDLSDEDKILAIETVLEMNGVHLEPYGDKFVRALPRANVRKDGIPLIMDPDVELGETSRVVSMMLSFHNIALDEAQKALEGMKSDKGVLNVFERTGTILVTDTEMNLNRMREIAKKIDIPTPVTENVFVRQVKHAAAADIKTALEAIVQESQKELEKQGRQANSAQQRPSLEAFRPGGVRLLSRNSQTPPPQPTSAASLVTAVSDADRGLIRGKVLILSDERSNKLIIVTAKTNMDFFDKVIEQLDVETTPDIEVKVYRLKYADAEDVSDMINDLIGNAASAKSSSRGNQNQNAKSGTGANMTRATPTPAAKKPANQRTGEAKTGELSKDNTTVLADKRINGLVVMTNKELVPTLEKIIESMDIKLSQVLIETVIIEVNLGDGLETGMDWVQKGRRESLKIGEPLTDGLGRQLYYPYKKDADGEWDKETIDYDGMPILAGADGASTTKALRNLATIARDGLLNYTSGGAYGLGGGANGGTEALDLAAGVTSNLLSKSFTAVFDSDKLGLSAIIHASKTDSRAKYIASPIVMTVDNKESIIEATSSQQFLTGWQAQSSGSWQGSGLPTPTYSSKEIGIKLKVTPKINPNGTVMLEVEEEYSQVAGKQTMLSPVGTAYIEREIDIPVTRTLRSDVLLENAQTVVFGGLTETAVSEYEAGIPILKDIPWIGKWLFGSVSKKESRSELLVFMTPYVLDDAQSAQAEAARRKKTLSDPAPWDDRGWSLSPLADPVSKKEQIRRLKDEARKQDEERKTKMAIEKWKVERVKHLKQMSKDERDLWLEIHKDELADEAAKEELDALMKTGDDEASQAALRELAASIREKKLSEADREMEKAEDESRKSE